MSSLRRALPILLMLAAGTQALAQAATQSGSVTVPLTRDQWSFQTLYAHPGLDTVPRFEAHLGAPSLFLPTGFAWAHGVDFRNGTLEADIAAYHGGSFFGLAFHTANPPDQYEVVFFRPHATAQTVQYSPSFFQMNAWQFYPEPDYAASPPFPDDQWVHLRIVVKGLDASVYLDTATKPTVEIHDLALGNASGTVGFWARGGGGYISNLRYTPAAGTYPLTPTRTFLPGAITDGWSISQAFPVTQHSPEMYPGPGSLTWQPVRAEREGMVLIGRYRRDPNVGDPAPDRDGPVPDAPGTQVVFARTTIASDRNVTRKMWIGYSDNVVVYLNGRALFEGRNSMEFRDPAELGFVYPYAEGVYLPLRKGKNELMLAVSEATAGWGFICRFDRP